MTTRKIEFIVGLFVLGGLIAIFYLAVQIGGARFFGNDSYEVVAEFTSAAGVNAGSRIEIAGVPVGSVSRVELTDRYFARVTMKLPNYLQIDDDTIASIKTAGLIGDRYISLSPGGSGIVLEPGDTLYDTESALDIESLISRFALGGIDSKEDE
ncbi:MAG: outer membrane lipid asymmetry maintenance protein MlaD [Verrucomicrobiota bacterium]